MKLGDATKKPSSLKPPAPYQNTWSASMNRYALFLTAQITKPFLTTQMLTLINTKRASMKPTKASTTLLEKRFSQ